MNNKNTRIPANTKDTAKAVIVKSMSKTIPLTRAMLTANIVYSIGEAVRLIKRGAVHLDNEVVLDVFKELGVDKNYLVRADSSGFRFAYVMPVDVSAKQKTATKNVEAISAVMD